MAVTVRSDLATRQRLAEAIAEIIGLQDGHFLTEDVKIEHDIRQAPRITVGVTKFLTPEEYSELFRIMHDG